ncbi:MAG: PilZ domain-containing protein [Planctomycetes bacterium]|nr:PilZ domain-containing protein [Planctomycetota bacterium]
METIEVPSERMLEVIKQGSLAHTYARVTLDGQESTPLASALLHTDRTKSPTSTKKIRPGERELLIAAPEVSTDPERGTKLELRFEYDNLSMVCYSTFSRVAMYTDPTGVETRAWVVEYPKELYQIQRRAFFRVRASATDPVAIGMTIPGRFEDIVDGRGKSVSTRRSSPIRQNKPKSGEVSGVLWDISGGGLSFTLLPAPPFVISTGAELKLAFVLPGIKEGLELNGRVVARKLTAEGDSIYCIEYIDVDSSARVRRSHNLILQYIAKRERELLKELRLKGRWG